MTVGSERRWGERLGRGYLGNYAPPFGGGVRGRGRWLLSLKLHRHPTIYLSSSEVVWNGILLSGDVCHPVIRVDVIDTEEVQTVQTEPNVFKDCVAMAVVIV